jgi:hypothetical protein
MTDEQVLLSPRAEDLPCTLVMDAESEIVSQDYEFQSLIGQCWSKDDLLKVASVLYLRLKKTEDEYQRFRENIQALWLCGADEDFCKKKIKDWIKEEQE